MPKLKNGPFTNLDDIDAKYHEFYEQETSGENAGKWVLTGVETGWKQTKALKDEAGRYRLEKKAVETKLAETEAKLSAFGDLNADEVKTKLDRITELEESAKGKVPEAKLNELADARVAAKLAPVQRELAKAKEDLVSASKTISEYKTAADTTKILDEVRANAKDFDERALAKPTSPLALVALNVFRVDESGNVVAKEGSGFTAGLPPSEVMPSLLEANPFFAKPSEGSGSRGSGPVGGGKGANVFADPNLDVRFKLQRDNPAEFDRQFKASGVASEFDTIQPKKSA